MGAFGDGLKRERERRKISLEDIAGATKIGVRFLRALEEEHFDQLPGGVFNKGFLRAYARHVGLDEEQAVADYLEASGEGQPPVLNTDPEPIELPKPEPSEETKFEIPWTGLALALLVIAVAFAIWGVVSREKGHRETVPVNAGSMPSQDSIGSHEPQPVAVNVSPAPVTSRPSVQTPTPTVAASRPAPSGKLSVLIKARDVCWIAITTDGKKSEVTLESGEEHPVAANAEIVLRVGNIGAVDLWFNGKPLPAQGDNGQVRTIAFDANGPRIVPPKPAEPTAQPQTDLIR